MAKPGFQSLSLPDRTVALLVRLEPFLMARPADRRRRGNLPAIIEAVALELAKRLEADPRAIPLEIFGDAPQAGGGIDRVVRGKTVRMILDEESREALR